MIRGNHSRRRKLYHFALFGSSLSERHGQGWIKLEQSHRSISWTRPKAEKDAAVEVAEPLKEPGDKVAVGQSETLSCMAILRFYTDLAVFLRKP